MTEQEKQEEVQEEVVQEETQEDVLALDNVEATPEIDLTEWEGKKLSGEVKKCLRLYPQDNDTDGFFVAKIIKKSEKGCEL